MYRIEFLHEFCFCGGQLVEGTAEGTGVADGALD